MMRRARFRVAYVLAMSSVLLVLLEVRLFRLQVLAASPAEQHAPYRVRETEVEGLRGEIRDGRGQVLARTTTGVDLFVWSPGVPAEDRPSFAARLHQVLGLDPRAVQERMEERRWARLAQGIQDGAVIEELRALAREPRFRVLSLEECQVRVYPQGDLLAPFLGFLNQDGEGAGLEWHHRGALQPGKGRRATRQDGVSRHMVEPGLPSEAPAPGATLYLTVDPLLQDLAEHALDDLLVASQAKSTQAIILDPRNGDVLALAQRPAPPAGRPRTQEALDAHRMLPVQEVYPPGSTMKPLMLAMVMEQYDLDMDRLIDCEDGLHWFGGRRVTDVHGGYGLLTPGEILVHSSNIGMAKLLTEHIPPDTRRGDPVFQPVLDYLAELGFGQKVLGWDGEATGLVTALPDFSRNYTLISLSYGYEIGVTPLQMAAAASALTNGGFRVQPRLVRGSVGPDGTVRPVPVERRRVLRQDTADTIRGLLGRVVEEGGTRKTRPRGYSMGGKTGTAEKEQDRTKITPSFFCFGPLAAPELLVLVVVDEPAREFGRFAATIAAPTAGYLYGEAARLLNIPPDRPEELMAEASWTSRGGGTGRGEGR